MERYYDEDRGEDMIKYTPALMHTDHLRDLYIQMKPKLKRLPNNFKAFFKDIKKELKKRNEFTTSGTLRKIGRDGKRAMRRSPKKKRSRSKRRKSRSKRKRSRSRR